MPDWEEETRFFLPNEDARIPVAAINSTGSKPHNCLFVTGSGFLAFEVLAKLPFPVQIKCVDLSPFQKTYFEQVKSALQRARNASELRNWFCEDIIPQINSHYQKRGQTYTKAGILHALQNFFHIDFFYDDNSLAKVQAGLANVTAQTGDIIDASASENFDFIHLSNVPDYLTREQLERIFENCALRQASMFFITTTACQDESLITALAKEHGYALAPECGLLTRQNRGLGAIKPERAWMRPGKVWLLSCIKKQVD